jgi:hypothetical protein
MDTPALASEQVLLDLEVQTLAAVLAEIQAHRVIRVAVAGEAEPHTSVLKVLILSWLQVVQVVAAEGRVMFLRQTHLHQPMFLRQTHLLIHNQSNHNPHIIRQHHQHHRLPLRKYHRTLHMSLRKNTGRKNTGAMVVVAMESVLLAILEHVLMLMLVMVTAVMAAVPVAVVALSGPLRSSWPTEL